MDDKFDLFVTLKEEMTACHGCSKSSKLRLLDSGNRNARIMIISPSPTKDEALNGKFFSGERGRFVDGLLKLQDVDTENVYKTALINCVPPEGDQPTKSDTDVCIRCLRRQFSLVSPEIVICLGRTVSQRIIRPDFSLKRDHGRWERKGSAVFMGTFDPNAFRYEKNLSNLMLSDFCVLGEYLKTYPPVQNTNC